MVNPDHFLIAGVACGVLATGSFGGAVMETLKLHWNQIEQEPVPARLIECVRSLGGDNGDNSSGSAGS